MNNVDHNLLKKVSNLDTNKNSAYNIRMNGNSYERKINEYVKIVNKEDESGIDIFISENCSNIEVHIPVLITLSGIDDVVYNDFYIGKNSNVCIYAGCAIHNDGEKKSSHKGIHRFFLEESANVTYVENHYGEGNNEDKVLDTFTEIHLKDNSFMEIKTTQIDGVNSSRRSMSAVLENNTVLKISEKIKTSESDIAYTNFEVELNGENSSTSIVSRAVAVDNSFQKFKSKIVGNNKCFAHVECDAIIQDKGSIEAIPEIKANNIDARLIHEATIGKIAGEELVKLMTLGLSEELAEKEIMSGFLK